MKKKKLSLNKVKVAKLQDTKMNNVIGGNLVEPTNTCRETQDTCSGTQVTCMLTCIDPDSIVACELSSPCKTLFTTN